MQSQTKPLTRNSIDYCNGKVILQHDNMRPLVALTAKNDLETPR